MTNAPSRSRRAALSVLAAAALLFLAVALAVQAGWTTALDDAAILTLRAADDPATLRGPYWVGLAMRDWTALGGRSAQAPLLVFALAMLLALRRPWAAGFLAAAVVGGWLLGPLLKAAFDRPRPELAAHLVEVRSPSFPSSHATQAAAAWLAFGAVLARELRGAARAVPLALAAALVLLIGVSRTFLGVHYPSDVLAGWCAGAGWAALCWTGAEALRGRRP